MIDWAARAQEIISQASAEHRGWDWQLQAIAALAAEAYQVGHTAAWNEAAGIAQGHEGVVARRLITERALRVQDAAAGGA